jgi:hypothetical protein
LRTIPERDDSSCAVQTSIPALPADEFGSTGGSRANRRWVIDEDEHTSLPPE